MATHKTTRRQVLKRASSASVGAVAWPYVVRSSAMGKEGTVAPSERIVMGCIGTGGQGRGNMGQFIDSKQVQVVAVCDVDAGRRDQARDEANQKQGNKDCVAYSDFRKLLARDDIDAVSIGTPDHWHALTAIAAANAGKDIYCEKPLANSVGEGRAICEAVRKNRRILQTGSQERSGPNARFACELVRNGRIGDLKVVRINLPCDDGHHREAQEMNKQPQPEMPVPPGFDYDTWLGHTPKVYYTEKRCHFWWRFNLRYGGGEMTDRGAHVIDLGQLGMGTDDTGPVEIQATGTRSADDAFFNAFFDYQFENAYANGVRLIGQSKGPRGLKFEGTEGWIFIHVHGARLEAEPESLLKETSGADLKVHLGRTPGHHQNFLDAVKTRKDPFAAAEIGHRTASLCHLNNIAMVLGRGFKWDPKAERASDEDANRLLTPRMRPPWHL